MNKNLLNFVQSQSYANFHSDAIGRHRYLLVFCASRPRNKSPDVGTMRSALGRRCSTGLPIFPQSVASTSSVTAGLVTTRSVTGRHSVAELVEAPSLDSQGILSRPLRLVGVVRQAHQPVEPQRSCQSSHLISRSGRESDRRRRCGGHEGTASRGGHIQCGRGRCPRP